MPNNISKALLRKKFSTIESPVKPEWIKVKIQTDKIKVKATTMPKIICTSLPKTDNNNMRPKPGKLNTCSITTTPPNIAPK